MFKARYKAALLLFLLCLSLNAFAYQAPIALGYSSCYTGYKYTDGGVYYSDVTLPFITGKSINLYEKGNFIPVSYRKKFKKGESSRVNYLGLVEVGNAGIMEAAKNGKITKFYYVEVRREKLFLSAFLPIYFNKFITTVYGE